MTKARKGFTLIEAIVTIAILGVGFSLTGVVVSQLIRVQDSASAVADAESTFQSVDSLISQYVSFVSLDTPLLSFEKNSADSAGVSFVGKQYVSSLDTDPTASVSFYLSWSSESKELSVTPSTVSGTPDGYLSKNDWKTIKDIPSASFAYDDSIDFLTVDITLNDNSARRFGYVLRTQG